MHSVWRWLSRTSFNLCDLFNRVLRRFDCSIFQNCLSSLEKKHSWWSLKRSTSACYSYSEKGHYSNVILWSPAFIVIISIVNGDPIYNTAVEDPLLYAFGYWLFSNNSACNPCLYFIFIESFRQSLKIVCSKYRAPELRLCPIRRQRRFETEQRTIELTSYRTVSRTAIIWPQTQKCHPLFRHTFLPKGTQCGV